MDLFKWTAGKKKKMNRDLERRDSSMVNDVHRGSQRKKRGEVVAKIKGWNTPPPKQPKKTKFFFFKNGTQQLALATFHRTLLHSTWSTRAHTLGGEGGGGGGGGR